MSVNAKTLATLSVPAHHIIGEPFSVLFPYPIGDWVNEQLVQYASTGEAPLFNGSAKLLPIMPPKSNMFFMGILQVVSYVERVLLLCVGHAFQFS